MTTYLADGIGASQGDSLATESGFIGTGDVWYVSSVSGTDASGYGRNREKPFRNISYAVSSSSNGDTIVVLADHRELNLLALDVDKSLVIVGEGSNGGYPTAVWTNNISGYTQALTISAAKVEIRNMKFTAPSVSWTGADGKMRGCLLEGYASASQELLEIDGDRMTLENNTFISVATTVATAPLMAIQTKASTLTLLKASGNVISGGASGWSSTNGAFYIRQGAGLTVRIEAMSLLLGSDIGLTSGVSGFISVPTATGGAQVRGL